MPAVPAAVVVRLAAAARPLPRLRPCNLLSQALVENVSGRLENNGHHGELRLFILFESSNKFP